MCRERGICVPRHRDRMQTPKQRPLLPTSRPPAYLQAVMSSAKSLFRNTFHITPMRSIVCAETVRNFMKTRIRGGGGYPTGHTLGAPPMSPAFGDRVGTGCPTESRRWIAWFSRNLKLETRNSLVGILVLLMTGAAIA